MNDVCSLEVWVATGSVTSFRVLLGKKLNKHCMTLLVDSVKYRCISSHYIAMHYAISRYLKSNCMLMHHIDSSHTHYITYHMTSHCITASHRFFSYALHHISHDITLHNCITSILLIRITSHIA